MNQGKLEVVKQEMAGVNINILGISELKWNLNNRVNKIINLNPLETLKRGYSVISKNGTSIKKVSDLSINDEIDIKMTDGLIKGIVKEIKNEKDTY